MKAYVVVDTLHLSVKYPHDDVFKRWSKYAEGVDTRKLNTGFPVGDFVLRGGGSGYKYSLWLHDARIYITDQVDDKCGVGNGMGLWVQLGPKFIIANMANIYKAVIELLESVGVIGYFRIRITRIDVAVDLLGISMKDQDISLWKEGWVGRSKPSAFHHNSRTGDLETINIGSRKSPVYLRIYDKVAQAIAEGDIKYWLDVWKTDETNVMRVEWEIKPNEGNFSENLKDFSMLNDQSVKELLNYLIDWGRFCKPNQEDSNRRRWKDTKLWMKLRRFIELWSKEVTWPTSRYGKEFHEVSLRYARSVSGTLAGALARFDLENQSFDKLIEGLEYYGEGPEKINSKAAQKAAIFSRL
jgi:hypothetical protein